MNAKTRIRPFGDRAWLLDRLDADPPGLALAVDRAYRQATVICGLDSILVEFPPDQAMPSAREIGDLLLSLTEVTTASSQAPRTHTVPVDYRGPDLSELAMMLGRTEAQVVAAHQETTWVVAAVGFAPGFAYLRCDDPLWANVRRRDRPRPTVPKGSVAVAAGMSGIYPAASPGGWQLIGTTRTVVFDAGRVPAALFVVGDRVRFATENHLGFTP